MLRSSGALYGLGLLDLSGDLGRSSRWSGWTRPSTSCKASSLGLAIPGEPDWIIMDEAESALDEGRRRSLFAMLARDLPDSAIVATGRAGEPNPLDARAASRLPSRDRVVGRQPGARARWHIAKRPAPRGP